MKAGFCALAACLTAAGAVQAQAQAPALPPAGATTAPKDVWRPKLLPASCARPEYPLASVRAGETGTTLVRLTVDEKGAVTQTAIARSSGHARLDAAAAEGLARCRFEPAHDSAGSAVAGVTVIEHAWRLEDAAPDPWVALRNLRGAGRAATADVAAVLFMSPSQATPAQRVKILRRVQQEATEQAGCASIESVTTEPPPAAFTFPPLTDVKTGRAIRVVPETWTITQCGLAMRYTLLMRFPEGEAASFTMVPLVTPKARAGRGANDT